MTRMGDLVRKLVHKMVFSGCQLGGALRCILHLIHLVLVWNMTEKKLVEIFDQKMEICHLCNFCKMVLASCAVSRKRMNFENFT